MNLEQARDALARALKAAAAEHGRPNAFTCGELQAHYGGPSPLLCGRLGRFSIAVSDATGFRCSYSNRAWKVE